MSGNADLVLENGKLKARNAELLEALGEVLEIAENNPAGYADPGEFDPYDESPEDACEHNASLQVSICRAAIAKDGGETNDAT